MKPTPLKGKVNWSKRFKGAGFCQVCEKPIVDCECEYIGSAFPDVKEKK